MSTSDYDFEAFFDLSLDLLCIANTNGYFERINPSFERILGWSAQELMSQPFCNFVHPQDVESTLKEIEKLASGLPTISFRNRYRCANGSYRHFLWTAHPDSETGLLFAIARDMTELIEATQKLQSAYGELEMLASTDQLTKVYNRRAFDKQLKNQIELMIRMRRAISLLMIDVDHFKQYNDRYGHPAGDRTLKIVANLLRRHGRATDYVARYGGEEFTIILPDTAKEGVLQVATKIQRAVHAYPWQQEPLTVSMGASTMLLGKKVARPRVDYSAKLISEADRALYYSKHSGRDQSTHISEIQGALVLDKKLERLIEPPGSHQGCSLRIHIASAPVA